MESSTSNSFAQRAKSLSNLTSAAGEFFDRDILPEIWFICGYTVASMHRGAVMRYTGFFPQLNVFGDGATTMAAKVGASLVGMQYDRDIVAKFDSAWTYDRVSALSRAVLIIDDPNIGACDSIDNFIWDVSNGITKKKRLPHYNEDNDGCECGEVPDEPSANCIILSSQALRGDSPASRLFKLHIPERPVNESALPALVKAMDEVIAYTNLSSIWYDSLAIASIEDWVQEALEGDHSQIAKSMAVITFYTRKFCEEAGVDFDAVDYAINHLCPTYKG